jgi:hypothetical protein
MPEGKVTPAIECYLRFNPSLTPSLWNLQTC